MENNQTMKASELRIGNLVNHRKNAVWGYRNKILSKQNTGDIKILGISPHCNDYSINTDNGWVYLKNCSPIPLTEEWLLRMGFELNFGDYILKTNEQH